MFLLVSRHHLAGQSSPLHGTASSRDTPCVFFSAGATPPLDGAILSAVLYLRQQCSPRHNKTTSWRSTGYAWATAPLPPPPTMVPYYLTRQDGGVGGVACFCYPSLHAAAVPSSPPPQTTSWRVAGCAWRGRGPCPPPSAHTHPDTLDYMIDGRIACWPFPRSSASPVPSLYVTAKPPPPPQKRRVGEARINCEQLILSSLRIRRPRTTRIERQTIIIQYKLRS